MKKLASLPVWQQYALGASYLLPWIALGGFGTDMLPEVWRFQAWPESIRIISSVLFGIFLIADTVFAFWYLFSRSHDEVV